jgi:HAD superfamily hydrolase (TIGR01509 family)
MSTSTAPRAALWDMDGTLLDSAEYHWLAWRDTMAEMGFEISHEEFIATFGQRNDTILRGWISEELTAAEIARISDIKEARYRTMVKERGVVLLPGVHEWLIRLRDAGWRQAIASAAPRANVATIIEVLGLETFFGGYIGAEDVQRGKPDPQVFQAAAALLGVPAERCVVLEDAPAGVAAGRSAGMRTIGVLTSHPSLDADVTVKSLDQLPVDIFDRLIAGS